MTGTAQNKLGELFVDIGVGGLGTTLKALNSVSASFLLTKNAATQLVKPIVDIGLKTASSAVGIGKMASALGTTEEKALKLQYYLKKFSSEDLVGDIANISNKFTDILNHQGAVDGLFARSMSKLHLNWQNYNGTFESTLDFIQDVKNSLNSLNLSKNEQLMHLRNLGLQRFQYLFEKPDFDIREAAKVLQDEIENEQKLDEAIKNLINSLDTLTKKVVNKMIEGGLIDNIGKIANWLSNFAGNLNNKGNPINDVVNNTPDAQLRNKTRGAATLVGAGIGTYIAPGIGTIIGGGIGYGLSNTWINKNPNAFGITPVPFKSKSTQKDDLSYLCPLPNGASQYTSNANITNNISINGDNAETIASAITNINVQDIQANIYQTNNQVIT